MFTIETRNKRINQSLMTTSICDSRIHPTPSCEEHHRDSLPPNLSIDSSNGITIARNGLTCSRCTNYENILEDYECINEQLQALKDAINLLTRSIVSTPATATASPTSIQVLTPTSANVDISQYQKLDQNSNSLQLDRLLQSWKLEQTGFPRLYNACRQLKENFHLTAIETDEAIQDIQMSRQLLTKEKNMGCKMKKVINKLCKENKELRKQNAALKSELKCCKAEKRMIVRSVRDYFVKSKSSPKSNRTILSSDSRTRNKENNNSSCIDANMTNSHPEVMELGLKKTGDCTNVESTTCSSEDETERQFESRTPTSNTNINTTTSVGCATLRLYEKQKSKFSIFKSIRSAPPVKPNVYELQFTTTYPGLQFLRIPPISKVDTIPLFLVCGYAGYTHHHSHPQRPAYGARLVIINTHSLEHEDWSMGDLATYVKKNKESLNMGFRNDTISDQNMKLLKTRSEEFANRQCGHGR